MNSPALASAHTLPTDEGTFEMVAATKADPSTERVIWSKAYVAPA